MATRFPVFHFSSLCMFSIFFISSFSMCFQQNTGGAPARSAQLRTASHAHRARGTRCPIFSHTFSGQNQKNCKWSRVHGAISTCILAAKPSCPLESPSRVQRVAAVASQCARVSAFASRTRRDETTVQPRSRSESRKTRSVQTSISSPFVWNFSKREAKPAWLSRTVERKRPNLRW